MSFHYRPEIDGLRAVAVLAVIFFHAELTYGQTTLFRGGYLGVDIFFVISGYLIGSIILAQLRNNKFSYTYFYNRRARRILPAFFTVVVLSTPIALLLMVPKAMKEYSASLLSALFFGSNFWFWQEESYWAEPSALKPLLHTWSLAVEEQFYLLFPIALISAWRFAGGGLIAIVVAIGLVVSLLGAEWASGAFPTANFFLLPTRGWELLAGVLLAKLESDYSGRSSRPLELLMPAVGLFLIAYSIFLFDDGTAHPSLITVLPISGTMLLMWFARKEDPVTKVLRNRILVGVGLISYSLYLWHFPVFALVRLEGGTPSNFERMALLGVCALLAVLTYVLVESPMRAAGDKDNRGPERQQLYTLSTRTFVSVMGGLFLVMGLFGLAGIHSNGFEGLYRWRYPFYAAYQDVLQRGSTNLDDNGDCHFHSMKPDAVTAKRIEKCFEKYGPGIVVLGDSHAMDLYNALSFNASAQFLVGISQGGCRPHYALPKCHYASFLEYLEHNAAKIQKVIFVQSGRYLLVGPGGQNVTRLMFEELPRAPNSHPNPARIKAVADYLAQLSKFAEVVWLGPRIEPHISSAEIFEAGCHAPFELKDGTVETFERLQRFLKEFLSDVPGIAFESQINLLRFDVKSDLFTCNTIYWRDGEHFSLSGERLFGERLLRLVEP